MRSTTNIAPETHKNWLHRYHLSSIRSNAIRHLNFEGLNVLELGAGMGACSRFIAENAVHLTAVEGTEPRMNALRTRLRDLNNWDGVVLNYQDFKTDQKYDVVCFFGVFEYSGKFIKAEKPFEWAINHAKSFLKDDGVLLISIENKNGLKYFAGLSEDHHPQPYYGICGYPETKDTKTFSRKEMIDMLNGCGLQFVDVQHLAPDYKCTRAVITDKFMQDHPIISANIMSNYPWEDYCSHSTAKFPTKLASVSLAKSGLLGEFSNSYLFISSTEENSKIKKSLLKAVNEDKSFAFLYTHNRKNNIVSKFIKKDKEYVVHKEWLTTAPTDLEKRKFIKNVLEDTPLYDGTELKYLFLNYAYYGKNKELMSLLYKYLDFAFDKYKTDNPNILQRRAFDAIPRNTTFKDGQFFFFDEEFETLFDMTKSHFLYRVTWVDFKELLPYFKNFEHGSLESFYEHLCAKFKVKKGDVKKLSELDRSVYGEM